MPNNNRLRLEYVPLSTLTRFSDNPKLHDLQSLVESFEKYGFLDPPKWEPTLNGWQGGLVEGNGREEALEWMKHQGRQPPKGIGLTDDGDWAVPVLFGNDIESEAKAQLYAIDHNALVLSGGDFDAFEMTKLWDEQSYKSLLARLGEQGEFTVSVDGDALDVLLGAGNGQGPQEPDREITQTEAEKYQEIWKVQPGDIWQLGRHKIACLDSTDEETVKGLVGDAVVTFVWADPPYGIEVVNTDRKTINSGNAYPFGGLNKVTGTVGSGHLIPANRYSEVIGDDTTETAMGAIILCNSLFAQATQVWWGANHYSDALPPSPCWVIWDKRVDIPSNNFADGEMAWVNLDLSIRIFRHRWSGLVKGSEHNQRRVHPTQKPVALPVWCFEKYGKPGDIIFDGFLGSGISVLAAEQLNDGRRVIGCELATEYIATTIQRWVDLTGQKPVLVER